MKKIAKLLLIASAMMLIALSHCYAQESYYYYRGVQEPLSIAPSTVAIISLDETDISLTPLSVMIPTRDVCSLLEITTDGQSLSLQRREPVKLISLQILDINGIALFTSACNASDDKSRYQIDISSLKNETPTIYYVVIDTDQGVCSKNINL